MKTFLVFPLIFFFAASIFAQTSNKLFSAGYEQLRITDKSRKRPIHLDIWYPSTGEEKENNYGISKGSIAKGAILTGNDLPVILLSHGAMGAASNYSWLAEYLSRRGYVVLGVSHFGESPVFGQDSIDLTSVSRFGDRTKDLNFALEFLLEQSKYAANLDANKIGAIGHSSGGSTVLMLTGVAFSPKDLADYCKKKPADDKGCSYPQSAEIDEQRTLPTRSTRSIKAVVALDPAVGPGFKKESLKSLIIPTLIIGSVKNDFLPYSFHAGYISSFIKKSKILKLDNGEGHFVYLDECTLPIKAMGISLCTDAEGVDRKAIHLKLSSEIEQFLNKKLSVKKKQFDKIRKK